MSNEHMTSPGPARDDPVFGDPLDPSRSPGQPPGSEGEGSGAGERAREATSTAAGQARDVAATARDEARGVGSTARDEARGVASTAAEEARHVAGSARQQAQRLAGDARHELRMQASAQLDRVAEGVDTISQQLSSMGQKGEPGAVTDLVREAAQRTQDVADRLRQGDVDETFDRLRSLGRNRPGLFLLGAFGLGMVAGRVARNLAQDPTSGNGNGHREAGRSVGTQAQTPAVEPAYAPGPAYAPDPAYGTAAAPEMGSGQPAYGAPMPPPPVAPVSDERWGS